MIPRARFDVTYLKWPRQPFRLFRHGLIHSLRLRIDSRVQSVDIHHMPFPIVLPRERLASFPRVWATGHRTVILASPQMLIVDMPVKVSLRSELLATPWMCTFIGAFMVPLVVTWRSVSFANITLGIKGD